MPDELSHIASSATIFLLSQSIGLISQTCRKAEERRMTDKEKLMNKGSIVQYDQGLMDHSDQEHRQPRPAFGGRVIHKSVPRSDVIEAREEFYQYWRQTESYRSM